MGFNKTLEETQTFRSRIAEFYDAEMVMVLWETKPEIISALLPWPLAPAEYPLVTAFVADYPRTNFDVVYKESALLIPAVYNGEEGSYCLSMPVTRDVAMAAGREIFGFPKKMADIHFFKNGKLVEGWTERRGVRFMETKARLTGQFNDTRAQDFLMGNINSDGSIKKTSFLFKHFPAPERDGFDFNPRLIRQETVFKPRMIQIGEGEIILRPSDYDPWAEVEVVKMLGAVYLVGDNSMLPGNILTEVDPLRFAPHAFLKWDIK